MLHTYTLYNVYIQPLQEVDVEFACIVFINLSLM